MFIYSLLNIISFIVFFICIVTQAYYIWKAIRNLIKGDKITFSDWIEQIRKEVLGFAGSITKPILIISLAGIIITNSAIHQLVGIHNLLLKPEGTYCFYVEASPNDGKTYTLPAQIRVERESKEIAEGKEKTYTCYYIDKVFFSNGGWLDNEDGEPVEINKPTYYYDYDSDEKWKLVLLNEHAYSQYVNETNNADLVDITFMFLDVIPIAFYLYVLCRKEKRTDLLDKA